MAAGTSQVLKPPIVSSNVAYIYHNYFDQEVSVRVQTQDQKVVPPERNEFAFVCRRDESDA